jgi:phage baseplate assembly protein W
MAQSIRGPSFPFRIDASGGVAEQSDGDKLKENIINILMTGIGERVMRRDYGAGLRQLLHDPNNDALRAIAQHQVAKALARFEQRVLLQDLQIDQDTAGESGVSIRLQYLIRQTRQTQQLSVPVGLGGI